MKILFLPLFKMPSGHHRVADALTGIIEKRTSKIQCKKVDLLSYSSTFLEKAVSQVYLKWIEHTPNTYDWAYKHFAYTDSHKHCSFKGIEFFFLNKIERLLEEERPDAVVCTHGFPSLLMSRLKNKNRIKIPVINVYTDYFINDIWGREGIDYHFVPTSEVKEQMIKQYELDERRIFVTGIPVHETFLMPRAARGHSISSPKTIIIAGGSSGLGDIAGLLSKANPSFAFNYIILCGNNSQLYNELKALDKPNISPLPYISSREKMNQLYEQADAIITKPGGITVSEALRKELPIFIHSALPGQEDVNLHFLKEKQLVYALNRETSFEDQMAAVLNDELELRKWKRAVRGYFDSLQLVDTRMLFHFLYMMASEGAYLKQMSEDMVTKKGIVSKIKKYAKKISISSNA
ncbi:UDP-N-acetylglucosamine:LPS N-acetylglucosamine transferase [Pullulanibacillus pueri]|uniref:Putative glycosyltransferase YkoN n=1 Tax=Pullulanibacillus pueri TaxID=1437324 RepID=A0A8J2ZYU8_9BACL|nr:glycosyltransferase [Pullulanibacillus pueri]MBM7683697.1 UDP-N-acetylglucosamine:LPS N-acetylglucosamine transferase [Pullulanibacillus pueri]GGH85239.1 putative glycosyltransferase YkoN [Pullulanibacillus pueri]